MSSLAVRASDSQEIEIMATFKDPLTMTIEEMRGMEKKLGLTPGAIVDDYVTPGEPWIPMTLEEYLNYSKPQN